MTQISSESYYKRAMILHEQHRYVEAERELRQALVQEPSHPGSHALLAMCLAEQERFDEAQAEADSSVGLAPDWPFSHYARAYVLMDRHRYEEALAAIEPAIALNPYNCAFFSIKASILFGLRRWSDALAAADAGLAIDPEHEGCINHRAMALVKLGRRAEAGQAIDAALARDPENATTHANQGWTLLHQGQHKKAMEHFREALRLDPQMEWARAGIVEALKARNPIYRIFLAYFLFMGRLSQQAQWGIIIGGYVAYRIVLSISQGSNSPWAKLLWPLIGLYIAFAVMTWLASPLFNLLLRLDRFGRYALSSDQKWGANLIGILLLGVIISGVAFVMTANAGWLVAAIGLFVLMIPASVIFKLHAWPRLVMAVYLLALLIVLGTLVFAFWGRGNVILPPWADNMINVFIAGVFLSQWVANGLLGVRIRR